MLDLVQQCEVDSSLVNLPYQHMVHSYRLKLLQVKGGKVTGSLGILPEMLKVGQTNGNFNCLWNF